MRTAVMAFAHWHVEALWAPTLGTMYEAFEFGTMDVGYIHSHVVILSVPVTVDGRRKKEG
jgi:hypothetical protein